MLHFISWKMYGISLIMGLGFFYGYLLYKNKALLKAWLKRVMGLQAMERAEEEKREVQMEAPKAAEAKPNPTEAKPNPTGAKPEAVAAGDNRIDVAKPLVVLALLLPAAAWAQTADGVTGINEANTMVRSYFDPAVNLMYAIGAILGIIGGVQVFRNMQKNRGDTEHHIAGWFGGCVFLVLVATVLKAFFGL